MTLAIHLLAYIPYVNPCIYAKNFKERCGPRQQAGIAVEICDLISSSLKLKFGTEISEKIYKLSEVSESESNLYPNETLTGFAQLARDTDSLICSPYVVSHARHTAGYEFTYPFFASDKEYGFIFNREMMQNYIYSANDESLKVFSLNAFLSFMGISILCVLVLSSIARLYNGRYYKAGHVTKLTVGTALWNVFGQSCCQLDGGNYYFPSLWRYTIYMLSGLTFWSDIMFETNLIKALLGNQGTLRLKTIEDLDKEVRSGRLRLVIAEEQLSYYFWQTYLANHALNRQNFAAEPNGTMLLHPPPKQVRTITDALDLVARPGSNYIAVGINNVQS